jgi:hypothetical protein
MDDKTLTHEQARLRLHDHVGENVYAGLQVRGESGTSEVFSLHGRLRHPLGERPGEPIPTEARDVFGSAYLIGDQSLMLPSLPGTITEANEGVEFELTDGLVLRIAWAGLIPNPATVGGAQTWAIAHRVEESCVLESSLPPALRRGRPTGRIRDAPGQSSSNDRTGPV